MNGFIRVQDICELLHKEFGEPFSVDIKVNWHIVDKRLRYFLNYSGSFGRDDLDKLDNIARKFNSYYEMGSNGCSFSLDLPYAKSYTAMRKFAGEYKKSKTSQPKKRGKDE